MCSLIQGKQDQVTLSSLDNKCLTEACSQYNLSIFNFLFLLKLDLSELLNRRLCSVC